MYTIIQLLVRVSYSYLYLFLIQNKLGLSTSNTLIDLSYFILIFLNLGTFGLNNFRIVNTSVLSKKYFYSYCGHGILCAFFMSLIFFKEYDFTSLLLIFLSCFLYFEILVYCIKNNFIGRFQLVLNSQLIFLLFFLFIFPTTRVYIYISFLLSYFTSFIYLPFTFWKNYKFWYSIKAICNSLRIRKMKSYWNFYKFYLLNNILGLLGWAFIPLLFRKIFFSDNLAAGIDYETSIKISFFAFSLSSIVTTQYLIKNGKLKFLWIKLSVVMFYLFIPLMFVFSTHIYNLLKAVQIFPKSIENYILLIMILNGFLISISVILKGFATKENLLRMVYKTDFIILLLLLSSSLAFFDSRYCYVSYFLWIYIPYFIFSNIKKFVTI
jgi:hypothetical protein